MRDRSWYEGAACIGQDSSIFFASERQIQERRTALALCKGCSVRVDCLRAAIYFDDQFIRGGTTYEQRRVMGIFMTALAPIRSSLGGLANNAQTTIVHTAQVSVSIYHISEPEQSQFSPIPPFELSQSVLGVSGIRPLSEVLHSQVEPEFVPSPLDSLDFSKCLVLAG